MNLVTTNDNGNNGYAVVDFETTGLYPNWADRVVEVGIIRLDSQGRVVDRYSSLVNPERDMGPTEIHRITAGDVAAAPTFAEISGDILALIRDTVFVAHNASFDKRFLRAEMSRAGITLPDFPTLCTMRLATKINLPVPGRKLEVLCDFFGINIREAHEAIADAEAAAEIFRICVNELGGWGNPDLWEFTLNEPPGERGDSWPIIHPSGRSYTRTQATSDRTSREPFISRLVARLPHSPSSCQNVEQYLAMLDRALEDRRVDEGEFDQLLAVAHELGMSKERAIEVHQDYLRSLVLVALDDDVITDTERADLENVRHLLGLTDSQVKCIMDEAREIHSQGVQARMGEDPNYNGLSGRSVCFTGTLQSSICGERVTKSMAEESAEAAGMVVHKTVTKSLDYLVVADPETMSGKAKKARKLGVRILAEPVFWQRLGISVE